MVGEDNRWRFRSVGELSKRFNPRSERARDAMYGQIERERYLEKKYRERMRKPLTKAEFRHLMMQGLGMEG